MRQKAIFFCLLICVFSACNYSSPEENFEEYLSQLEKDFCYYHNSGATLQGYETAYPILGVPDSNFWANRQEFAQLHLTKLSQFQYLKKEKRALQEEWQTRLSSPLLKPESRLSFYNIQSDFGYILEEKTLTNLEKLQIFNHKLRAYPLFLASAKQSISQENLTTIPSFIDSLTLSYFFLTQHLAENLKLDTQEEHIQKELVDKIEKSRIAIKDLIAFCQSFEYENE